MNKIKTILFCLVLLFLISYVIGSNAKKDISVNTAKNKKDTSIVDTNLYRLDSITKNPDGTTFMFWMGIGDTVRHIVLVEEKTATKGRIIFRIEIPSTNNCCYYWAEDFNNDGYADIAILGRSTWTIYLFKPALNSFIDIGNTQLVCEKLKPTIYYSMDEEVMPWWKSSGSALIKFGNDKMEILAEIQVIREAATNDENEMELRPIKEIKLVKYTGNKTTHEEIFPPNVVSEYKKDALATQNFIIPYQKFYDSVWKSKIAEWKL